MLSFFFRQKTLHAFDEYGWNLPSPRMKPSKQSLFKSFDQCLKLNNPHVYDSDATRVLLAQACFMPPSWFEVEENKQVIDLLVTRGVPDSSLLHRALKYDNVYMFKQLLDHGSTTLVDERHLYFIGYDSTNSQRQMIQLAKKTLIRRNLFLQDLQDNNEEKQVSYGKYTPPHTPKNLFL